MRHVIEPASPIRLTRALGEPHQSRPRTAGEGVTPPHGASHGFGGLQRPAGVCLVRLLFSSAQTEVLADGSC